MSAPRTAATAPSTATGATTTAAVWAVDCPVCQLTGDPLSDLDTAGQRAAVHDDRHHRGVPTAAPIPLP
jgi:hypothetical protein